MVSWRMFDRQLIWRALDRALAKTGNRIAARIAMIAMTTSSSIRVNAADLLRCPLPCGRSFCYLIVNPFLREKSWAGGPACGGGAGPLT
jgi:hypothetical protein